MFDAEKPIFISRLN